MIGEKGKHSLYPFHTKGIKYSYFEDKNSVESKTPFLASIITSEDVD